MVFNLTGSKSIARLISKLPTNPFASLGMKARAPEPNSPIIVKILITRALSPVGSVVPPFLNNKLIHSPVKMEIKINGETTTTVLIGLKRCSYRSLNAKKYNVPAAVTKPNKIVEIM